MRKLSPPTLAAKQQHAPPNKSTDNLLKRFAVTKRVSLLILLITVALLLAYILTNFLNGLLDVFTLVLLPIVIPLAFMIIRLVYRQLKDTNVPLYVITLVSILPVVGAIYLDTAYHHYEGFDALIIVAEMAAALIVFALALLLTGVGHVWYQLTMMTKYRQPISALMLASTVVAVIMVIPLTIIIVIVMMRIVSGDDFLLAPFDVIVNTISVVSAFLGI